MERWYAVCCKPRQELVAQENLLRQGYYTYLPRIQITRSRRGKWIDSVEVMFPRYIFIRVDTSQHSIVPIRSTRGVVGLVSFSGRPAVISNEVINALIQREAANSGLHQDNRPLFCLGESVKLVEGPLTGMEGIFVQEDGEKRVTVLLELLGKANKISMNRDWITQAA